MFRKPVIAATLAIAMTSDSLCAAQTVSLELPLERAKKVAYSPDGSQVAIGGLAATTQGAGADGLVVLLDQVKGREQSLLRHKGTIKHQSGSSSSMNMIHALAYSPDGKTLAVASELGLKLWNPADGTEVATLLGYGADTTRLQVNVISIAFSPDGKWLATSSGGNRLRLWNVEQRELASEFEINFDDQLTFSPDGKMLFTAGHHNRVGLWRKADGEKLAEVHAMMGPLYDVAIDREGKAVAAVGEGGEKLWRIGQDASGDWRFSEESQLTGHFMSPVRGVEFSPDGRWCATNGDNGALVLYDVQTRKAVGTLLAGGPFAFSPDGEKLAVAQWLKNESPGGPRNRGTRLTIWKLTDVLDADRLAEQARAAAMDMAQTLAMPRPDRRKMQGVVAAVSGPHGDAATPILVEALKNPLVGEKQLLLLSLYRIAEHDAQARAAIIESLRTGKAVDLRAMAATVLAKLPADVGKEAAPSLVEAALKDESPHVQSAARRALEHLDPTALQQVVERTRERGPLINQVTKRDGKLVYQGRTLEEWIKRLSGSYIPNEIYGRPSPNEPLAAIRAIGPAAAPLLIETLKSNDWQLRQAAAAGLGALGPVATPAVDPLLDLIEAANERNLNAAGSAANAVASILRNQKEPPKRLAEQATSGDPAVRLSAARTVAVMSSEHPRGLPVLNAALAAISSREALPRMVTGPFSAPASVTWLGRVLADEEAPLEFRVRAAATLARMGEDALPALPAMLQSLTTADPVVSKHTQQAIQKMGSKAVPKVRDALQNALDDPSRQRLATTLWGMGNEGGRALNDFIEAAPGQEFESLWWAAVSGTWNQDVAMQFQRAIIEALKNAGQPVRPLQAPSGVNSRVNIHQFQPPSVGWSMKLLTDREAPRSMRMQSASALHRVSPDKLRQFLPVLLNAVAEEEDRWLVSQAANMIQRIGPEAIPAVKDRIEEAQSDYNRRELLRALSSLGKVGQQEFARLMRINPQYGRLFKSSQPDDNAKPAKDRTRKLSPIEQQTLAEADRSSRPLTNGDFAAGLDGWSIEGGAAAFRVFDHEGRRILTTFGQHQDADTGRLFQCFRVPDDAKYLTFKLHGGSNREKTYVALWRKDYRHFRYTARNDNKPFGIRNDIRLLRGEVVTLEIVDHSAAAWGFIGAEDFRMEHDTD